MQGLLYLGNMCVQYLHELFHGRGMGLIPKNGFFGHLAKFLINDAKLEFVGNAMLIKGSNEVRDTGEHHRHGGRHP